MNLVVQSATYLPTTMREAAVEIAYLSVAGWGAIEIGSRLGISGRRVNAIRAEHAQAVVHSLSEDGYADTEIVRLLGIPTTGIVQANGTNGSTGRKSGQHG